MSLYGAFDQTKHLDELQSPLIGTAEGTITPAQRVAAVLANLGSAPLATEAGAGITGGSGTVYASGVSKIGGVYVTRILIDLTGLSSATDDLDVIGVGASAAHIGQVTAAENGTIIAGRMTCFEVPSSLTDIDLYAADEGTAVFEDAIGDLTNDVALVTSGGAWTAGEVLPLVGWPAVDQYLYLTNGAADTADPFTAGRFLIELFGYDA